MSDIAKILDAYGKLGVLRLQQAVNKFSATGKTADSIRYEVKSFETKDTLTILGRPFFEALETGRGPRKSSQQGDFLDNMLDYMNARGIAAGEKPEKRVQLARFLTLKINREGDQTYKQGGRIVYTPVVKQLVKELTEASKQEFLKGFRTEIKSIFRGTNN